MNYNRGRPIYTRKCDSEKEANSKKQKKKIEIINPNIKRVNNKHHIENEYYEMRPPLTESLAQKDLIYNDKYYTLTSQDSFSQGGEGAASLISFSSEPSSGNDSENTSAPHSLVEKDTFIESLIAKGCVDDVLDSLDSTSGSVDGCDQMRSSGCLPFLIQQLHLQPAYEEHCRPARDMRQRVLNILTNIVHNQSSARQCRRESKILEILWSILQYSELLRDVIKACESDDKVRASAEKTSCEKVKITVLQNRKNLQGLINCGKFSFIL